MIEWNVYIENENNTKIVSYNIFKHVTFLRSMAEFLINLKNGGVEEYNDIIDDELRRICRYYFDAKVEWEIVLTDSFACVKYEAWQNLNERVRKSIQENKRVPARVFAPLEVSKEISAYDQLELNWNAFSNYVWSNRKDIMKFDQRKKIKNLS